MSTWVGQGSKQILSGLRRGGLGRWFQVASVSYWSPGSGRWRSPLWLLDVQLIFQVIVFYMLIEAYALEVGIWASIARRQRKQHEPLNFLLKIIPWACSGSKDSSVSLPIYEAT